MNSADAVTSPTAPAPPKSGGLTHVAALDQRLAAGKFLREQHARTTHGTRSAPLRVDRIKR